MSTTKASEFDQEFYKTLWDWYSNDPALGENDPRSAILDLKLSMEETGLITKEHWEALDLLAPQLLNLVKTYNTDSEKFHEVFARIVVAWFLLSYQTVHGFEE